MAVAARDLGPEQVQPQDLEAEETLLGAMLIASGAIDALRATGLEPDEFFFRESHGAIYDVVVRMRERGDPVDAVLLVAELERLGKLEQVGGRVRIHELAALVPASKNAPAYARIVREKARQRRQLAALAAAQADVLNGGIGPEQRELLGKVLAETPASGGLIWESLSEVEMRSIVFADKPLFQAAAFHLVVGRKGAGKGTLLANIAARVTRGELGEKRNVIWIGSEDSAAIDIKPRIIAAEGDPGRIWLAKSWIQLPRDIEAIGRKMDELGEVGMVVIDPVGNHIGGKNSNAETEIRDAIAPLNALADAHDAMVFGVRHLSEKECARGVLAAILGSSAWVQTPRAVLAVAPDDDDPEVRHVQCVAGNRLPEGTPGRMFRIEGVLLPELANEVTRGDWIGDSQKDVEQLLAAYSAREPSKSASARELILDLLEGVPEMESDALDARVAEESGVSAKTARNLRGKLKSEGLIRTFPTKDENGVVTRWNVQRTAAARDPR